jgi:hypothetical protein
MTLSTDVINYNILRCTISVRGPWVHIPILAYCTTDVNYSFKFCITVNFRMV